MNNLRRRGQTLCDHPDAGTARKSHVEQTVRDTEEQWRTLLQAAKEVEAAAGAELTQRAERRQSEVREELLTVTFTEGYDLVTQCMLQVNNGGEK